MEVIASGLFAFFGAVVGAFVTRRTTHEIWLYEKRTEAFSQLFILLEEARRTSQLEVNKSDQKKHDWAEITFKIDDAYRPILICSKKVSLLLPKNKRKEFSDLIEEIWTIEKENSNDKCKKIYDVHDKIQSIFCELLINTASAKEGFKKFLSDFLLRLKKYLRA